MTTTNVRSYTRKDGTRVSSYSQGRQSAAAPRHASGAGRVSLAGAGVLALAGVFEVVSATANLLVAVLSVLTVMLLAWGGHRASRRRRRSTVRRIRRRLAPNSWSRSRSPAQWQALTDRQERLRAQRWARRDETWGRRKAAVSAWWQGLWSK